MRFSTSLAKTTSSSLLLITLSVFTLTLIGQSNQVELPSGADLLNHQLASGFANSINSALPANLELSNIDSLSQSDAQIVNFCKIYNNNSVCQYCIRDMYLSSGSCVAISYANILQNCNIYASATTCYQCDTGFAPNAQNTACVAATGTANCGIWANQSTCFSCLPGGFLSNGVCINVPNCIRAISTTQCQACANNYYLNTVSGNCVAVASVIANCLSYNPNQMCATCAKGYALDVNGGRCFSSEQLFGAIDENCQSTIVNTGNYCNICRQGYYLLNGACSRFNNDESCFILDPVTPSLCRVCMAGYWKTALNGPCQVNTQISNALIQPDIKDSVKIMAVITSVILGMLMI